MRYAIRVLVVVSIGTVLLGCDTPSNQKNRVQGPVTVATDQDTPRLASAQVITGKSPFFVDIALANPTKNDLVYAVESSSSDSLCNLGGRLLLDGKPVKKGEIEPQRPRFKKEQVRTLKPGESVFVRYELPHTEIDNGKYELRLIYEVHPKSIAETEFGLTPFKLEHTILLEVR